MQAKLRTYEITPNENICFPIGTILAVENLYEQLNFSSILGKHKTRGIDFNSLIKALLSYKLTENFSIDRAHKWINQDEVLEFFNLEKFNERVLYRTLQTLGSNKEEIILDIQDVLFSIYNFEHTNINMDWTSIVLYGDKSPLGKYGYSRNHRPDKKQITLGVSELADPINLPVGITVEKGNVPDQTHFKKTYQQVKSRLNKESLVVFDKGANSIKNLALIKEDEMNYLTAKKLNTSDDKLIKRFDQLETEVVDKEKGIYGIKIAKPSSTNYLYFSEALKKQQLEARVRKVQRMVEEAKEIQKSIDENKKLPKKFRINNKLIDISYSYQTKLVEMTEKEAFDLLEEEVINGREGFFCLKSRKNLTLIDALETYRKKDSLEKIFNSLKNEIEIKPLRVWTDESIYGAIIIGFIAQLLISLMRYEFKELKHTSTKFIKKSLSNLTVTVDFLNR
ncbi:Mobile element protein [Methanosarcina sp. MTP4]|nr:Mobile element protein [Methanosarcina sp. MTP4]